MAPMALWGQDKPAQKRQGVTVEGWHRSRLVGQWLSHWVPEQRQASFAEPLQKAFVDRDCPDGVMGRLKNF